jgi:hypothetical protein
VRGYEPGYPIEQPLPEHPDAATWNYNQQLRPLRARAEALQLRMAPLVKEQLDADPTDWRCETLAGWLTEGLLGLAGGAVLQGLHLAWWSCGCRAGRLVPAEWPGRWAAHYPSGQRLAGSPAAGHQLCAQTPSHCLPPSNNPRLPPPFPRRFAAYLEEAGVLPEGWQYQSMARPHDEGAADERHAAARRQQRRDRRERAAREARMGAILERLVAGGWACGRGAVPAAAGCGCALSERGVPGPAGL